ncbi:MAG TPA: hypothetical protein VII23_15450, partial [Terriglobales bacterium]
MIASASVSHVSKKEATSGGIAATISEINSSEITPGPLGILDTSPNAQAPCLIASCASCRCSSSGPLFAVPCDPYFGSDTAAIQIFHQEPNGPEFQVPPEDLSHGLRFRLVDRQATLMHVVAERNQTTHPHPLALGG